MKSRVEELLDRVLQRRERGAPALPPNADSDAETLGRWRSTAEHCPAIQEPLDERLPEWDVPGAAAARLMVRARAMVQRADKRLEEGLPLLPRLVPPSPMPHADARRARVEEQRDALRLLRWQRLVENETTRRLLAPELVQYVDANLPEWRNKPELVDSPSAQLAYEVVERSVMREVAGQHVLPKQCCAGRRTDPPYSLEERQEHRDAEKLMSWRRTRSSDTNPDANQSKSKNSNSIEGARRVMDFYLPEWRCFGDMKAMRMAEELVARAKQRQAAGLHLLPKQLCKKRRTTEEDPEGKMWQEHVDAQRLVNWRCALRGKSHTRCSEEVRAYLDAQLPGWSAPVSNNSSTFPPLELEWIRKVLNETS